MSKDSATLRAKWAARIFQVFVAPRALAKYQGLEVDEDDIQNGIRDYLWQEMEIEARAVGLDLTGILMRVRPLNTPERAAAGQKATKLSVSFKAASTLSN